MYIVAIVLTPGEVISCGTFKFSAVLRLVRLTPPHQRPQVDVTFHCVFSHDSVCLSPLQVAQKHRSVPPLDHLLLLLLAPTGLAGIHVEAVSVPSLLPAQVKTGREPGKCNRCSVHCALSPTSAQVM